MATANYGWLKEYDGSTFFPGTKPAGNSEKPVYIGTSGLPAEIGHTIKSDVPENAEFTDTKVTQKAAISTDGEYPVILANSTVTTEETNTVNKTNTLKYNPSTKTLTTDTIDINSLKLNQDVYHFTDADGDIIATINSSGISATQFNGPATKLGTVDKGSTKKPIYLNDGVPTEIGYTIESNVPSNAEFTDTKVTSAANHYTPTANTASALSVDASSTTAATWGSTDLVTGVNIQRDAKGHVTGLSVDSIQMPAEPTFTDTNTTYDLTTSASTTDGKINLVAGGSGSGTDTITIKGSGATTVTSDASGNITISSTDTNTTYSLSGASTDDNSTYTVTLTPSSGSATTAKVPAATDTVAGLMTANQV
ncbi:MAG: hypothetical protein IKB70_07800 [Bacilli bacterium]|nr:hypothetical protein [Bacilli bacterium]